MAELAHEAIAIFATDISYVEGTPSYDDGIYGRVDVAGTLRGVIQPASDAAVALLPEGQWADIRYLLHTQKKLKVSVVGGDGGQTDTFIQWAGQEYKVVVLADWSNQYIYKYGLQIITKDR